MERDSYYHCLDYCSFQGPIILTHLRIHDDVIKWKYFRVTGHCAGNSSVPGVFPAQRPVTRSFDVLFDLRRNKWLSKQSRGWWFETQSRPLWRHRNEDTDKLIHPYFMQGVITLAWPDLINGLIKPVLMLGHEPLITSYCLRRYEYLSIK